MANDEAPRQSDENDRAVAEQHDHEACVSDDPHTSSMPDGVELVRGIPQAVWAAHRLGDNSTYAICANTRVPGEISFWLCERAEAGDDGVARWRVSFRLVTVGKSSAGIFEVPVCWVESAQARLTTLIYPTDDWSGYVIEGMPNA